MLFTGRPFFELSQSGGGMELVHGEDMSGLVPMTFSEGASSGRRRPTSHERHAC